MTPDQVSEALKKLASRSFRSEDAARELGRIAASIGKGKGGKSPPTVTLIDVTMSKSGGVEQEWAVYGNGQKVTVTTVTDGGGDVKVSGQDLDLDGGLTAQQAVAFILQGAHPRYYPKPGRTVTLDKQFMRGASAKFSSE